jgi:rod shape-determining protein MreC
MKVRTLVVILFASSLLVLALDRGGLLVGPRTFLSSVVLPVQVGWYRFTQTIGKEVEVVGQIGTIHEDNFRLLEENDRLKAKVSELKRVEEENLQLRAQISSVATKALQLLPAQTLGFLPDFGTKELLLSEGSLHGVKIGQVVVVGEVALGKISSVQPDRSTLRLITDPSSKVLVKTSQGSKGILIGQFQAYAKLTKVLQEEKLSVGDIVFTSGEEDWPKGLIVGEVAKVSKHENELFQEAEVKPLVLYDRQDLVFVVVGNK